MKERIIHEDFQCNICRKAKAVFDGKTVEGPWAYMCEACFARNGIGLGLGCGQKLITKEKKDG
jgi:hypothetical protein